MIRISQTSALALAAVFAAQAHAQPNEGYDVIRHNVRLEPDFGTQQISADQEISFQATTGLRTLSFTDNALVIDSATINGQAAKVERDGREITFIMPASLSSGAKAVLKVHYRGKPKQGMRFDGTSLFTSYFACDWMLCSQDAPGDKALLDMNLILPRGMDSLGPGTFGGLGKSTIKGKQVHRWRLRQPYSAYLYGFAVGKYSKLSHRLGNTEFVTLTDATLASRLPAMQAAVEPMIAFLSDKAGMTLPAGRYTQLLVAGSEAQEAATYSVLGVATVDADLADPANGWIQIHELAHMWWGNSITCESWQDFWLNEGIATFMTAAWKEHRFGRAAYNAELDGAHKRLAKAKAAGWDKPLAFAGTYPSLGIRRAIQYSKGALFMDALRIELGDQAFWAGLKAYTRAHAGGTVKSKDFQQAMEQASGRDLSPLFTRWVYGESASDPAHD